MEEKARKIVETLARSRRVEEFVKKAAHTDNQGADLADLCQEVYMIILSYEGDKIVDLWEHGDMDYFLARIITNQLWSKTSRFHYLYRKFRGMCVDIEGMDFAEDVSVAVGVQVKGGGVPSYESGERWKNKTER